MNREDILEKFEEIEFFSELKSEIFSYLPDYIYSEDLYMVRKLVKAGASPNSKDNTDDYLHHLLSVYQVTRSSKGDIILELMIMLSRMKCQK